eukprot:2410452-Rhodomonas_salina.1
MSGTDLACAPPGHRGDEGNENAKKQIPRAPALTPLFVNGTKPPRDLSGTDLAYAPSRSYYGRRVHFRLPKSRKKVSLLTGAARFALLPTHTGSNRRSTDGAGSCSWYAPTLPCYADVVCAAMLYPTHTDVAYAAMPLVRVLTYAAMPGPPAIV